jgi:hypothetical protein
MQISCCIDIVRPGVSRQHITRIFHSYFFVYELIYFIQRCTSKYIGLHIGMIQVDSDCDYEQTGSSQNYPDV